MTFGAVPLRTAAPRGATDETLMRAVRDGDVSQLGQLFERYHTRLFEFLSRMTGNRVAAEDLVQDVFVRILKYRGTYRDDGRFETWLFRIARNQCIDESRRRAHRKHPSLDAPTGNEADGPTLHERVAGKEHGADRRTVGNELKQRMAQAIDALPEEQREVFVLRQVQNLAFKEIAEITGVSENTVKSRMRYALERLQGALAEYQDYAEELR